MNRQEVWDLVRRLRLRLVVNNGPTSDNRQVSVLNKRLDNDMLRVESHGVLDIICNLAETIPNNSKDLPATDKPAKRPTSGVAVAKSKGVPRQPGSDTIDMISNAGVLDTPNAEQIPNNYQFEIIRLRRRVDELECIVRDRDSRVVSAIAMLEDELAMYRTLLHDHVAETHDGIKRRVLSLESTLETLKAKGSKFYPALEIPERFRKKE